MSEPARSEAPQVDVRLGSTANALQPVSSAERSLGAGRTQWAILLLVAGIVVLLLVIHPFETVSALTLVYVACLPVSARAYLQRKRQDEAAEAGNTG